MGEVLVRPLRRDDDRSEFSCGQPDLDRFFVHYAGQNQFKLGVATTYIAEAEQRIAGFVTICVASIERAAIPSKRLQRRMPAYPLPVLRVARLGVDRSAQGRGVGRALLRHAFLLAARLREELGCVGIVTDAKPGAVGFYGRLGFLPLAGVTEGQLHGEPRPMFLPLATVLDALSS